MRVVYFKLAVITFLMCIQAPALASSTSDDCWEKLNQFHAVLKSEPIDWDGFERDYTPILRTLSEQAHNDIEKAKTLDKLMLSLEGLIMYRQTDKFFSLFRDLGPLNTKLRVARAYFRFGHSESPPAGYTKEHWFTLASQLYCLVDETTKRYFDKCHEELTEMFQQHRNLSQLRFIHLPISLRSKCCLTIEWFVAKTRHINLYDLTVVEYLAQTREETQTLHRRVSNERLSNLLSEQVELMYIDLACSLDHMLPQDKQRYGWCLNNVLRNSVKSRAIYDLWQERGKYEARALGLTFADLTFEEWLRTAPTVLEY